MKKILLVIIFLYYSSILSQIKIDTSDITSIQYEWKIKKNDSTLTKILTKYKSGIYKEEFPDIKKPKDKYPFVNIFESKSGYLNRDLKSSLRVHYWSFSNGFQRNLYNKYGHIESTQGKFYGDSLLIWQTTYKKVYRRKGKLKYLLNENNEKEIFHYDLFGKLKKTEIFRDSVLYQINYYKNGLLIKENFPTRKKYRKEFTYEYDNHGRLVKRDDSDYDLYNYYYNQNGIIRKEKIYKKRNRVIEYSLYQYDKNGELIIRKDYNRKNKIIAEFSYNQLSAP